MLYKGLRTLGLELVPFDLEDVKKELIEILHVHADSLRKLCLGRNRITVEFLQHLCANLHGCFNQLELIDLTHLKEANKINWVALLQALATLREEKRKVPLRVHISDYQTQKPRKALK